MNDQKTTLPMTAVTKTKATAMPDTTFVESAGRAPITAAPLSRPSQVANNAMSAAKAPMPTPIKPMREVRPDCIRSITKSNPTITPIAETAINIASAVFRTPRKLRTIAP